MKELKRLTIISNNGSEKIFLDDEELPYVAMYKLENSFRSTAKLTVTMYVTVGHITYCNKITDLVKKNKSSILETIRCIIFTIIGWEIGRWLFF